METDFITAFGRLLRDGTLRDAFAINPSAVANRVQLKSSDLPAWLQLVPADVEFQATVLLRKRLDLVKYFAPETCSRAGGSLWKLFESYARVNWPPEGCAKIFDAFQFCQHLNRQTAEMVAASEWNRLRFALSKRRAALHWARLPAARGKARPGLQIFLRGAGGRWREFFIYLGF